MATVTSSSSRGGTPKGARVCCINARIADNGISFSKSFDQKSGRYIPDSEPHLCDSEDEAVEYFRKCIKGTFKEEKGEKKEKGY